MSGAKPESDGRKVAAENRKARHDYTVLDTIEAGLELRGTEVKSLRDGQSSLAGSYAVVQNGQATLLDFHIAPYKCGNVHNHEPKRPRRLLLHRKEIDRLFGHVQVSGQTLVPLRVYFRHGIAKVELGICRGKQFDDRRETLRRKEADRDAERAIASRTRGR